MTDNLLAPLVVLGMPLSIFAVAVIARALMIGLTRDERSAVATVAVCLLICGAGFAASLVYWSASPV